MNNIKPKKVVTCIFCNQDAEISVMVGDVSTPFGLQENVYSIFLECQHCDLNGHGMIIPPDWRPTDWGVDELIDETIKEETNDIVGLLTDMELSFSPSD